MKLWVFTIEWVNFAITLGEWLRVIVVAVLVSWRLALLVIVPQQPIEFLFDFGFWVNQHASDPDYFPHEFASQML